MLKKYLLTFTLLAIPCLAWAESGHQAVAASAMAGTFWGITALVLFVLAYSLVPLENNIHPVSYTHLTLPTSAVACRSRWSPYH